MGYAGVRLNLVVDPAAAAVHRRAGDAVHVLTHARALHEADKAEAAIVAAYRDGTGGALDRAFDLRRLRLARPARLARCAISAGGQRQELLLGLYAFVFLPALPSAPALGEPATAAGARSRAAALGRRSPRALRPPPAGLAARHGRRGGPRGLPRP
jgi:hypothetical protein